MQRTVGGIVFIALLFLGMLVGQPAQADAFGTCSVDYTTLHNQVVLVKWSPACAMKHYEVCWQQTAQRKQQCEHVTKANNYRITNLANGQYDVVVYGYGVRPTPVVLGKFTTTVTVATP
jgi:hypothetical protein